VEALSGTRALGGLNHSQTVSHAFLSARASMQIPAGGIEAGPCNAADGCALRRSAPAWISPAPEEVCPAGLLSGGGVAVPSAVPAGPLLTLMCSNVRRYFTRLGFFLRTVIRDLAGAVLADVGLPCERCLVLITSQRL
jgi:hypothetical protein